MVVSYSGIAGKRGYNPTKIVLHNDAGSQNANAAYYKKWLEGRNPELGFAHYYVASDGTFQAELDTNKAWHCGNTVGNRDYIGIEICQSNGDEATFKANEQKAFKLAYDLCKKYNIAIVPDNFPLHKELSATSCPHRSWDLHGQSAQAVKQYFAEQVANAGGQAVTPTPTPQPSKKSVDEVAREVINGSWGGGQDRFNRLAQAGYNAQEVQNRVNALLGTASKPTPSKPAPAPQPTPPANGTWIAENGTYTLNSATNLRTGANTSSGVIALLPAGSVVKYNAYMKDLNGYVWIRQPRGNGYGYLATGYSKNGKRQDYWGTFN